MLYAIFKAKNKFTAAFQSETMLLIVIIYIDNLDTHLQHAIAIDKEITRLYVPVQYPRGV